MIRIYHWFIFQNLLYTFTFKAGIFVLIKFLKKIFLNNLEQDFEQNRNERRMLESFKIFQQRQQRLLLRNLH